MDILLDSFKKRLSEHHGFLFRNEIKEYGLKEDVIGDERKRIIVNHAKKNLFGQISICEDGSLAVEILRNDSKDVTHSDTLEIIFSYYGKYDDDIFSSVLKSYLTCMSKI